MFDAVQVNEDSLAARVAKQIEQLVKERELKAGDRLPNEFELANELQVGRGTVREAVKQLVARNVLEIRRGKGTFVAKHPGRIKDPLGFDYVEDQSKLALDIIELRKQLEPWIAAMAAERATEEDIAEIEARCRVVEDKIRIGEDHIADDIKFHTAIARASKNLAVVPIIPVINRSVGIFGTITKRSLRQETIDTHRAVTNAIAAHDPKAAYDAMEQHLLYNEKRIQEASAQGELLGMDADGSSPETEE